MPLYPHADGPEVRMMPRMRRESELVTAALRTPLKACIDGKADWPLLIHGGPGTGKTCAALVVCDYYLGQYWAVPDLCDELRRDFDRGWGDKRTFDLWEQWERWPLAVLDELAIRQRASEFEYDTVKKALDLRVHKPLILVSNIPPSGIVRSYDDRIASRCCAGTVFKLDAKDRRMGR